MTQISSETSILGLVEKESHSASLEVAPVECVDSRDEVSVRHSEARKRGVSELDSSRLEGSLPGGSADMDDGRPNRVDNVGQDRLIGRCVIPVQVQRPDQANLGLGIQHGGKRPDGKLNLDRKGGEEREGCHGGHAKRRRNAPEAGEKGASERSGSKSSAAVQAMPG